MYDRFLGVLGAMLALFFCILPLNASADDRDTIPGTAAQAVVYDTASQTVLYQQGIASGKVCPASVTKLFAAWTVLQYLPPDREITAGEELALIAPESSIAAIAQGETMTVARLVEGMLLPSGNDAAYILSAAAGREIAGDSGLTPEAAVAVFVAEMNAMARDLGLTGTQFMNPDGFHLGAHYSSLTDLVAVARLALEDPVISRYVKIVQDESGMLNEDGDPMLWHNTNALVDPESEFYRSDAVGLKTGYTNQAGNCLLSAFRKEAGYLIVGVFGCPESDDRFRDTLLLADAWLDP